MFDSKYTPPPLKGEHIPSEEEKVNIGEWVQRYHDGCFNFRKDPEVKDWVKFKEATDKYIYAHCQL